MTSLPLALYGALGGVMLALAGGLWFAVSELQETREELGVIRAAAEASERARTALSDDLKRREQAYAALQTRKRAIADDLSQSRKKLERIADDDTCADRGVAQPFDDVLREAFTAAGAGPRRTAPGAADAVPGAAIPRRDTELPATDGVDP